MKLKPLVVALSLLTGVAASSAATSLDAGPYTVNYDESTSFGFISSWFSSGSTYGFTWTVPDSVQVISFGDATVVAAFELPSFTLTPNAGWALSGGVDVFFGNLVFTEVGGATTNIEATGDVSIDGGPATTVSASVPWVITASADGFLSGYFGGTGSLPIAGFSSVELSNASVTLSSSGGTFGSIIAQPQNKLEYSFTATPVPEPESYALLLAGLGVLGFLTRRRHQH